MFPMLHRVFSVQLLLYVMTQSVYRVYTFYLLYVACVADVTCCMYTDSYESSYYRKIYGSYTQSVHSVRKFLRVLHVVLIVPFTVYSRCYYTLYD